MLQLSCVVDGQPHSIDLLDCYQEQDLKCSQVLGKLQKDMAVPLRQVRLQLVGQDLAGNAAPQSFVQVYALADFRIPAVRLPAELRALEDKIAGNASLILELVQHHKNNHYRSITVSSFVHKLSRRVTDVIVIDCKFKWCHDYHYMRDGTLTLISY